MRITVVLADEHRLFLAGLARLLSSQGISVVGETESGVECLELARRLRPSVLVVSLTLSDQSGLEVVHSLRKFDVRLPVLALAPNWSQLSYHSVIRAGATAMVSKENDAHQLIAAIESVLIQPSGFRKLRRKERYISLRQLRILRGLTAGRTNEEIAIRLNYSASTIKAELRELFETFGTMDRSQLINSAAQQGFVSAAIS
ncbi:MAG: response regulator transcription factor [Candidatus Eremiobacteraeota bacterium]|nr:response regulator transcription factor [Candidatus Eremiobacteraeota bacterium]MCW5871495.1 response regulator transcription factor [Candidatus Eremiobacteraeota bacterium]